MAVQVTRFSVESSRVPASLDGFTLIHVSDLHGAQFGKEQKRILAKIRAESPDLIVVTGDLIDSVHPNETAVVEFFRGASGIAPVFCVAGNHEFLLGPRNFARLKADWEAAGARFLINDSVWLEREPSHAANRLNSGRNAAANSLAVRFSEADLSGAPHSESLCLAGISDPFFAPSDWPKWLDRLTADHSRFTILLSHRPERFEAYAACGPDLVLSGHAHGGQFRLPFLGGIAAPHQGFFPRYSEGLCESGPTRMIVSRGLGNSFIPVRLGNRPELVVVKLRKRD